MTKPKLKNKAALMKLRAAASTIKFPCQDPNWVNWSLEFRRVFEENFGYQALQSLAWNEDRQCFSWAEKAASIFFPDATHVRPERVFHINPRSNLVEAFELAFAEIAAWDALCTKIRKALVTIGAEST